MKKTIKKIVYVILSLLIIGIGSFFIWASFDYEPDNDVLAFALQNKNFTVENTDNLISIVPINYEGDKGYIFYPGAKVHPEAYISKLSSIAIASNVKIFIPKMFKNLAFFGINRAAGIQKLFPKIKHWYIGGHSMGGSMACMYFSKNSKSFEGILLFGTYSGTDISEASTTIVSINGEEDGIFPPEKIRDHKVELPLNAQIKFIKGMNHADIGNYGLQSGDNPSKLINDSVVAILVNSTKSLFQ